MIDFKRPGRMISGSKSSYQLQHPGELDGRFVDEARIEIDRAVLVVAPT